MTRIIILYPLVDSMMTVLHILSWCERRTHCRRIDQKGGKIFNEGEGYEQKSNKRNISFMYAADYGASGSIG